MDPIPDLITFKIVKVLGIEPATPWLAIRHADRSSNEMVRNSLWGIEIVQILQRDKSRD